MVKQRFEESKFATVGHNVMLANFYSSLKKHPVSVNKNILDDEKALDSCINIFIAANVGFENENMTRNSSVSFPSFSFLKRSVLDNYAIKRRSKSTRAFSESNIEYPSYLIMFYDEFFN